MALPRPSGLKVAKSFWEYFSNFFGIYSIYQALYIVIYFKFHYICNMMRVFDTRCIPFYF